MASKIEKYYGSLCDGEIEISSITIQDLDEALDVLNYSFLVNESVCKGTEINLPENVQARLDLRELCKIVAKDGVSLKAKHVPSNKIVAVTFNKVQLNDDSTEDCFFVEFKNKYCKSPNSKALMSYMITMDEQIDIFKLYSIDCLIEIMFLATLPEFEQKKIGRTLCKYSIDLAKDLSNGIDLDRIDPKLRDKRPKAVSSLFTSSYSQKMGEALNFTILNRVPFSKFSFDGKAFSERIGPLHPDSVLAYMKL